MYLSACYKDRSMQFFSKTLLKHIYDYSNKQLVAPFEFKGHINADLFYGWFEQDQYLYLGQTIGKFLNNCNYFFIMLIDSCIMEIQCSVILLFRGFWS